MTPERALLPAEGLGTAPLGGLYTQVSLDDAVATVQAAVDAGYRYFDTAPLYGYGAAERALGIALGAGADGVAVSTKVGRIIDEDASATPGGMFAVIAGAASWDFSADGVRRSLEASLERLDRSFVDVVYIHDPDEHARQALDEAYPALERLRSEGTIGAIGVGMNEPGLPARFVAETDIDAVLVAGRYTLLDRSAQELFAAAKARGVHVVAAGVYNSGILTGVEQEPHFDYAAAPRRILDGADRLRAVCEAHGVSLAAAAVRFVVRCDAVDTVVVGARSPAEATQNWTHLHGELPRRSVAGAGRVTPRRGGGVNDVDRRPPPLVGSSSSGPSPGWTPGGPSTAPSVFGDLHEAVASTQVGATVAVQTASSIDETAELLSLAESDPLIAGVVGWLDLEGDVQRQLDHLAASHPLRWLVGVRHQAEDEPDPGWLSREAVVSSVRILGRRDLAFDLLVKPHQLPAAIAMARATESTTRLVLDHCAKPPIDSDLSDWTDAVRDLARFDHVACKLSGLVTEADWQRWTPADLAPVAEVVLEYFGPQRVMFGSDWPVCLLAASYQQVTATAKTLVESLSPAERQHIFADTAQTWYRLP